MMCQETFEDSLEEYKDILFMICIIMRKLK